MKEGRRDGKEKERKKKDCNWFPFFLSVKNYIGKIASIKNIRKSAQVDGFHI